MGLASRIFDKVVEKTAEKACEAVAYTAVETTAIVTKGAVTVAKTVAEGVKDKRAAKMAAKQDTETLPEISQYDIDLFYAKVAMCAYIANADHNLSDSERAELNRVISVSKEMYGAKATQNAKRIINNPGTTFMMVEPFLGKIRLKDLDTFLIFAEEIAQTDSSVSPEEEVALGRIRSYIESRRGNKLAKDKKAVNPDQDNNKETVTSDNPQTVIELTCPKCSGHMQPDAYGYKADCNHCGYSIIMNPNNAPAKELFQADPQILLANQGLEEARSIEFFTIRPDDYVQFYLNNTFIGDISDTQTISMNFPKARTALTMRYGKNYRKSAEVIIPEDGHDYQIYGGRPDKVVYKLYVFPYGMFDDYLNAVFQELNDEKIQKWISRHKGCKVLVCPDHFIFTYNSLFGDKRRLKRFRYSKETIALAKELPVRMREWEDNGYMYCIKKDIFKKYNKSRGYKLREDGMFT